MSSYKLFQMLNPFVPRMQKAEVGIDLSSTSIKLVHLSAVSKGYVVKNAFVEPLPFGCIDGANIISSDILKESLHTMISKYQLSRGLKVVLSLPTYALSSKDVFIGKDVARADVLEELYAEAREIGQDSLQELAVDYFQMLPSKDKDKDGSQKDQQGYRLFVTRRFLVEERVSIFESVGFQTVAVSVDELAGERSFFNFLKNSNIFDETKLFGFVNLGGTRISLDVYHGSNRVYSKSQDFGGRLLTNRIMELKRVSYSEAEQLKKNPAELGAEYTQNVLPAFRDEMITLVERLVQSFFTTTSYRSIDHVFLAGGSAKLPEIRDRLSSNLKLSVANMDPFFGFQSEVDSRHLSEIDSSLVVAAGLSLGGIVCSG